MNTWKAAAHFRQSAEERLGRRAKVAILGIGHELGGDDAAGLAVAGEMLQQRAAQDRSRVPGKSSDYPYLLVIAAGPAPENFTATLRRFSPDLVIFIDAAQMDGDPGEVRWLEQATIDGYSGSTHTQPLTILAEYLTADLNCQVALLGIQPAQNETGAALSQSVQRSAMQVAGKLINIFS